MYKYIYIYGYMHRMAATFAGRLLSRLALFAGGPGGGDAMSQSQLLVASQRRATYASRAAARALSARACTSPAEVDWQYACQQARQW
jgi:hypothetical protein